MLMLASCTPQSALGASAIPLNNLIFTKSNNQILTIIRIGVQEISGIPGFSKLGRFFGVERIRVRKRAILDEII